MGGFKIKVENVVASAILNVELDLEIIAGALDNVQYEPKQFPGVVYKMDEPKAALLIFSTGKIICTGARSISEAEQAVQRIVEKINDIGVSIPRKPVVDVQNLVASAKLPVELNLTAMAISMHNVEYEPEQFPGLVYRMADPKVVFLLFASGKIVITGARSIEDAERAVDNLVKSLKELGLL